MHYHFFWKTGTRDAMSWSRETLDEILIALRGQLADGRAPLKIEICERRLPPGRTEPFHCSRVTEVEP